MRDVFIVGGGPAGLAGAIAARLRGLDVEVCDASQPPIDKVCGEGMMPDGMAAARALGLDVASAGRPFRGIRFVAPVRGREERFSADFPQGPGVGLRRPVLHQMLLDRAAEVGVRMRWGAPIGSLDAIRSRWIVGADGGQSAVRRWAGLEASHRNTRRYGFRRHYALAPWSEHMEIHWGESCQIYVTPVAADEVCVVLISRQPRPRLDEALEQFPGLARQLRFANRGVERGAVTASRRLKAVYRGNVVLVGDASGSVDAITGEGLCMLFQQAIALAGALEAGDLSRYAAEHRRIGRRPGFMADLMLLLDERRRLRTLTMATLAAHPKLFARLLALHVGESVWSPS